MSLYKSIACLAILISISGAAHAGGDWCFRPGCYATQTQLEQAVVADCNLGSHGFSGSTGSTCFYNYAGNGFMVSDIFGFNQFWEPNANQSIWYVSVQFTVPGVFSPYIAGIATAHYACNAGFQMQYDGNGNPDHCAYSPYFIVYAPPVDQGGCNCNSQDSASKAGSAAVGEPISPGTGNEYETETDYRSGDGLLTLTRAYNSNNPGVSALGPGWIDNFHGRHIGPISQAIAPQLLPEISNFYGDPATACVSGWNDIVSGNPSLSSITASYVSGSNACLLSNGISLPVYSTNGNTGLTSTDEAGLAIQRPDGSFYSFSCVSGTCTTQSDIAVRLSISSSGYVFTDEHDNVETYDLTGALQTVTLRSGYQQTLTYSSGVLTSVTDTFGRTLSFSPTNRREIASVSTPDGSITYGYDGNQRLVSVTFPDNSVRGYQYGNASFPNALTAVVDENQSVYASIGYDSQGRAYTSSFAGGAEATSVTYNSDGSATVMDALGTSRTYQFSTMNGRQKISGISGPICVGCGVWPSIGYDTAGYLSSRTDWNGNPTTYVYDDTRGLETSRTEASGTPQARTINTTYSAAYRLPTEIDEPGRTTTFSYDGTGNLLTKTVKDTATNGIRTWTYSNYTAWGQPQTVDGPRTDVADVTQLSYYPINAGDPKSGQLQTITDALAHVTTINNYDASGRPLSLTDPNGLVTALTYSPRGWLISKQVGSELTQYGYYPTGLLQQVTLPNGASLAYTYDAAHRLTDLQDQLGNKVHYTLDAMGNRTGENVYDPSGALRQTRSRVYNSLNQLYQDVGAGNSETTTYGYDGNGNRTDITDPLNHHTGSSFDALNRLVQVTDPNNGVSQYGYNALDQLTSVTDPRTLTTSYGIDALDNVASLQSPDTGTTASRFDNAGNVLTRTDAKGQTTQYQYDALNRLTQVTRADNTFVTYSYDDVSNGNAGIGHLTSMADPSGYTAWVYDLHGRVIQKTQTTGTQTLVTDYGYDSTGQLTAITLPSQSVIGYGWSNGQISSVTINGNPLVSNLVYQPFSGPTSWTFANGESVSRTYDLDGRLSADAVATVGYDSASRITSLVNGGVNVLPGNKTYGYDELDRLTSFTPQTGTGITYGYDATGNRTSQSSDPTAATFTLDTASNRITSIAAGPSSFTPSYDANGSLTIDLNNSYSYDAAGRLASANGASYVYNGRGERTQKTVGFVTTLFDYDETGHLIGEYDGSGTPQQETIWLGDQPIAVLKGGSVYYIHTDHLNTPRQIDDSQGNPVWAWDTITFGASAPNQDPFNTGNQFVYNLRMPGQYFDSESGLFQNNYRDYDPATGRYIESDPIGLAGGLNTYAYVGSDPIELIDPTGLARTYIPPPRPARRPPTPEEEEQGQPGQRNGDVYQELGELLMTKMGYPPPRASPVISQARGGVYVLRDPSSYQVMKSGRSCDIVRRQGEHARDNRYKDYEFERIYGSDDYDEIRGLEQYLHELYNPPLDRLNAISPANPNRQNYMDAAQNYLNNSQ